MMSKFCYFCGQDINPGKYTLRQGFFMCKTCWWEKEKKSLDKEEEKGK